MGFLNGLGRFLQGKPVFEAEQEPQSEVNAPASVSPQDAQPKQSPFVDAHGYKVIPEVTLDHLKATRAGDTMTVTVWATNRSDRPVRVDNFALLGQKQVFQHELRSNKGETLVIYKGPVAPNEHDSHAQLVFRLAENGDVFENVYHVEFNRESDGKFVIEELHEDGPVRDI
jgi:hypothetical protein